MYKLEEPYEANLVDSMNTRDFGSHHSSLPFTIIALLIFQERRSPRYADVTLIPWRMQNLSSP